MNVRGSAATLSQAAKDLSIEWQETKTAWRDVKSQQFETKYLDPLPGYIARTMTAIDELETLLRKVRSDCE